MLFSTTMNSPLGPIRLDLDDQGLIVGVYFIGQKWEPELPGQNLTKTSLSEVATDWPKPLAESLQRLREALQKYFDSPRPTEFSAELLDRLAPRGTAFQKSVWAQIALIKVGGTLSYGEIAKRIGQPNAARAVGAATGRNPISVIIPCHRVLGTTKPGSMPALTGYAGGLERKTWLLQHEGIIA